MFRIASTGPMVLAFVLAGITQLSCTGERGTVRDATAEAASNVGQRLNGRWMLATYQPEVALEANLQLLLNNQFEHLVVTFSGNTLRAQGPGVDFTRTYRVTEVYGEHFSATVYDSAGVGTDSSCDFSGTTLIVNGITPPWRGGSTFRRMP
jgi:hypothetical protein